VLSEAAQAALPVLRAAFDQIAEAARRLRIDDTRHFLTISVGPTFASTWLVRRLGRFKETFPGVEVRLDTTDALADFLRDGVDVGIRFGGGTYPGLEAVRLFAPADLAHQTLLHVEWGPNQAETYDWQMWLRAAGAEQVDFSRGPRLSRASIALQAAAQGEGVALGSDALSSDELASGRLVRPFDIVLPLRFAYYLVYPQERARMPKIAAFRQWILAEAGTKASLG
jgi:LysR family glycine cleavage system transcriptional activator